jgi:hypothetical protein
MSNPNGPGVQIPPGWMMIGFGFEKVAADAGAAAAARLSAATAAASAIRVLADIKRVLSQGQLGERLAWPKWKAPGRITLAGDTRSRKPGHKGDSDPEVTLASEKRPTSLATAQSQVLLPHGCESELRAWEDV